MLMKIALTEFLKMFLVHFYRIYTLFYERTIDNTYVHLASEKL